MDDGAIRDEDQVRLAFPKTTEIETVRFWPAISWEKPPPRMPLNLALGSLGPGSIKTGPQISQPRRLDRLRDVHLTWSNFFIKGDCCTSIYDDTRTAVSGIVDWPELSGTAGISRLGEDFVIARSRLQNAERVSGRILLASSNEPHNWGMWLLYVLPIIIYFIENRQSYDRLLVFATHPNMRAMLSLLGLTEADMILHDCSKAHYFDSIDVLRQPQRDYYVAEDAKAIFAKLRETVTGGITAPSASRIYVGRRRWTAEMGGYRALLNEPELVERLAMMGYREIDPERLRPEQQIALFGSARQIVVLGGAALFNAVFCKPGTQIVDIESNADHLDNHSTILSSMGIDYGIIVGLADQSDPAFYNKRWTLDVEQAVASIASFMD